MQQCTGAEGKSGRVCVSSESSGATLALKPVPSLESSASMWAGVQETDKSWGMRAGEIHSRGGYAQAGTQLQPADAQALAGCEGLVLRLAGDGQAYSVLLTTSASPD